MFSKIFSIVILCMSLNHNKSPFQVKTPSFDTFNVNTPTEPLKGITPPEPERAFAKLQKPELSIWQNTASKYSIKIQNNNEYNVAAYISNSTNIESISGNDFTTEQYNWGENQSTVSISVYFHNPQNLINDSDPSTITINRPQTKLKAPTYEILKNDYDEYSFKITNPNNFNAILYCQTEQNLFDQEIAANDYFIITEPYEGNTYTITAYLYKMGGEYKNSDTITINFTRPSAPNYLSGGYGAYNYIPSTHQYEINIQNTNPVAVNYSDNFSNNFTIQANSISKIKIKLTPSQESLTLNGTFTPTSGNYQKTNIQLNINTIHYIDITSISRQTNGNITIKYKNAQPINSNKWTLDIKDEGNYTDSINLNIQNTEGSITIENQPASKLYLTIFYGINIVEKKTLDEVKTENEIVDIPSIMLLILTLPFSFLSQAFDLTLFKGTQYAFNAADIILTIVGAIIIFYIIKLIIKIIKLF